MLWASASIASACIADAGLTGIVFDQPPEDAPDDALILAVSFADLADDTPIDDVLKARVTNVIQGDYRSDYVPVEIPSDSCARPFLFGTEGIVVGYIRTGLHQRKMRLFYEGRYFTTTFTFGASRTRLVPMTESLQNRYRRGGPVPFAPQDRVEPRQQP